MKKVVKKDTRKKLIKIISSKIEEVVIYLKKQITENKFYKFIGSSYFGFHIAIILFMLFIGVHFFNTGGLKPSGNITPAQMFPINLALFVGIIFQIYQSFSLLMLEKDVKNYKGALTKEGFINYIEYEYKKIDSKKSGVFTYMFNTVISLISLYIALYSAEIITTDYISNFLSFSLEEKVNWIGTIILVPYILFLLNSVNSGTRLKYLKKMYYSEFRK